MPAASHAATTSGPAEPGIVAGRRACFAAIVSLVLLPLLWLFPSVFGDRVFVPYDVAEFPPSATTATPEQVAAMRDGANYDVTEPPVWFVPELELAKAELAAGRLPTWNPHARGGAPLHAHGLIGLCHPPNWVALLAHDPRASLGVVVWLDLALGGLLALGFLRALGFGVLPAWFGAVLFQLSAPMAVNAFFWMRLASFLWLPGVLWSVLAVARSPRARPLPIAALAVTVGMAWLGGFPPYAITTSCFGAAFAGWLVLTGRGEGARATARRAGRLLLGFALGGLLAAPQLLPSARFFPQSARKLDSSLAELAHSSFEAHGLLGWLVPDAFGHPSAQAECPYAQQNVASLWLSPRTDADGKAALPNFNYTEYAVFVGTLGFLLAIAGAVLARGRHVGFARLGVLLALGMALFVPGVRLLFHLPLVQNVVPMRWLAPATILVAWLAACGLERLLAAGKRLPLVLAGGALALLVGILAVLPAPARWQAADPNWIQRLLAGKYACDTQAVVNHVQGVPPVPIDRFHAAFARLAHEGWNAALWLGASALVLAAFAVVPSPRRRQWLGLAVGGVTALQLGLHGSSVTRGVRCERSPETPVHAFLRAQAAAAATTGGFTIARGSAAPDLPAQLPPGQLMVPGLRDLAFYTHFDGRSLQPLERLFGAPGKAFCAKGYLERSLPDVPVAGAASVFTHPLLDLLGVRFVLATQPLANAGVRVGPELRGPGGEFFVYERPHPAPRAFTVGRLLPHASDDDVVAALTAATFAPRQAAHALAADVPPDAPAESPDAPARAIAFV
ncbi:MAG: hypothetical protein JNK15_05620, partial [Planctomycetes bacterium]|nr:hypothetical protein [Planctomycetota bacterium]